MEFTVRDWMMDLVVFIDPDKTVSEALALMRRRYIHSLMINQTREFPQYGILTSTDICDKIVAQGRNPATTKVSEVMTSPIFTVTRNMPLNECAAVMKEKRIHHLPVTDENGTLIGMISATDFLVAAEAMGKAPGERIS
ncbi:MAG TPA: CBS domain-containing protein [Anaerolineaceae bacterium]|nr:CBS domain-containing protein [Anaerolineaceae bacterium]